MATKIHWNELVYGKAKDPNDPSVHKHISLIAILAWVGLGADGLSSACYGPAATFRALGEHRHLAPYLALATIVTVSILSAAYSSTIHAFPSGGGGYTVATRTLGRTAGMICGCALVLDYILTAGISVAAGADALFALLPAAWAKYKFVAALSGIAGLMILNFRGVKESIKLLLPVFVLFLITHAILIVMAIVRPVAPAAEALPAASGAGALMAPLAFGQAFKLLLMAFSRGAGTYTGIEAISNSLTILREPRVQTARRAMIYMAASLSIVAGGLLLGYLHQNVSTAIPEEAKTLNATLAEGVFGTTGFGGFMLKLTMISEATLLIIAAQAGFIDGPRVLASMAVDSWVPRWFSRLSDSLTVSRGILFIGLGGIGAVMVTRGKVEELVVIYSFCVFVTFLFSQTGMVRYWFTSKEPGSVWRGLVSVLAALLSATILTALLMEYKLGMAGLALASILVLASIGLLVRWHYGTVSKGLKRLDMLVDAAEADPHRGQAPPVMAKNAPTAVFLVSGYNGAGMHTVLGLQRMFPDYFKQMIFLGVGAIDFDRFKGRDEFENLKASVEGALKKYETLAAKWGFASESRCTFGVDVVEQLEELCGKVAHDYPRAIFFCGDLIFQMPSFLTRMLHAGTAEELQRRIRSRGLPLIVMPIRV